MFSLRLAIRTAVFSLGLVAPALADVDTETRLIADSLYSESTLDATFGVLQPILSGAVANQLRAAGFSVTDPDGYTRIFLQEFRTQYAEIIRAEIRPVLSDMFTEEELADIAAFIRTPSGQKFFAEQGDLSRAGARIGQVAGARAGQEAAERIAARLDREGISVMGTDGNRVDALKFLRGY